MGDQQTGFFTRVDQDKPNSETLHAQRTVSIVGIGGFKPSNLTKVLIYKVHKWLGRWIILKNVSH